MKSQVSLKSVLPYCLDASIVLLVVTAFGIASSQSEEESIDAIVNSFSTMSREELLDTWHTNCHRRCNQALINHVRSACENDPYRIDVRKRDTSFADARDAKVKDSSGYSAQLSEISSEASLKTLVKRSSISDYFPFLPRDVASLFLRERRGPGTAYFGSAHGLLPRRNKRTPIMEECCYSKPCAWEEYAEYCHGHQRSLRERASVCA